MAVVLALATAAVLSGSRSLLSISEWVLDADREALSRLGIGPGVGLPSEPRSEGPWRRSMPRTWTA